MGSAIGPAFTYLVTNVPAQMQAVFADVAVNDGWVTDVSRHIFVIGRNSVDVAQASSGTNVFVELGAQHIEETFEIPCYIDCGTGGDDQSESRNDAVAMFDAFVTFLRSDLTLGGALTNGRYAQLGSVQVDQTYNEGEAMQGRRTVISFSVVCRNKY